MGGIHKCLKYQILLLLLLFMYLGLVLVAVLQISAVTLMRSVVCIILRPIKSVAHRFCFREKENDME